MTFSLDLCSSKILDSNKNVKHTVNINESRLHCTILRLLLDINLSCLCAVLGVSITVSVVQCFFFTVPMDLDVKLKAVMIGAVFLIVSTLTIQNIGTPIPITVTEPSHEIMVLFVLHKLILQMRICSHPVGLDV